jgi:hypothetical protein
VPILLRCAREFTAPIHSENRVSLGEDQVYSESRCERGARTKNFSRKGFFFFGKDSYLQSRNIFSVEISFLLIPSILVGWLVMVLGELSFSSACVDDVQVQ